MVMGKDIETIYIVDDDLAVREGLSSLLRATGKNVRLFACGADSIGFERVGESAPSTWTFAALQPQIVIWQRPWPMESSAKICFPAARISNRCATSARA